MTARTPTTTRPARRVGWIVVAAAAFALIALMIAGVRSSGAGAGDQQRPSETAATNTGEYNGTPLSTRGGWIQGYTRTYAIYWLPSGYTYEKNGTDIAYANLINRYLNDVGGSTFYNVLTQYHDGNDWVHNDSTFVDAAVDTSPYPTRNGVVYTTDADIRAEVAKMIKQHGWTYGQHEQFFVYTASGVLSMDGDGASSNNGSNGGWCAYHGEVNGTAYGLQNVPIVYGNMPDQEGHRPCLAHPNGTQTFYSPNDDYAADAEVSITSHEQFEMITDPDTVQGWRDTAGWEIGDKCAYTYGAVAPDGANVVMNGHRYILQEEWSNAANGCEHYVSTPYN